MAFSPITQIENISPITTTENWAAQYKEALIEQQHDTSQLTLILPDDCLVVMGPPRLAHAATDDAFFPVGFLNNINISESRQVQPLKAIGSRRHIFAATNAPVQGSIARMMFMGRNLANAMYGRAEFGSDITDRNSKYANGGFADAAWFSNLEEDIFRVPFGLGIIYNSPATLAGNNVVAGAEYIEVCTLVNRNTSIASGQAMIMEQVSFMADRVLPWESYDAVMVGALDGGVVGNYSDM